MNVAIVREGLERYAGSERLLEQLDVAGYDVVISSLVG